MYTSSVGEVAATMGNSARALYQCLAVAELSELAAPSQHWRYIKVSLSFREGFSGFPCIGGWGSEREGELKPIVCASLNEELGA